MLHDECKILTSLMVIIAESQIQFFYKSFVN